MTEYERLWRRFRRESTWMAVLTGLSAVLAIVGVVCGR